jgi:aminoglycoside phosphotransferase (APT) family kinase protein
MKPQRAVLASNGFQPHRLVAWLRESLPGLHGIMRIEPMGDSNCSFRLRFDDRGLLLRTQTDGGNLFPLASGMRREYRVLEALAATEVPVPKTVLYCDDSRVAGTPFYVAEMPEGDVFTDYTLPGLPPERRRAVFFAMAETMARLHRVDWAAAGLADYARPTRFFAREVAHWTRRQSAHRDMVRLGDWLLAHVPDDNETVITHGDFRLGNLVFDPDGARVVAVVGWERSTLSHPLADVAHSCMPWHIAAASAADGGEISGLKGLDLAEHGIPTQAEYLTHYRQCGGHAESVNTFHLAFSLFRAAAVKFENGERHGAHSEAIALARHAVDLIDGCGA